MIGSASLLYILILNNNLKIYGKLACIAVIYRHGKHYYATLGNPRF